MRHHGLKRVVLLRLFPRGDFSRSLWNCALPLRASTNCLHSSTGLQQQFDDTPLGAAVFSSSKDASKHQASSDESSLDLSEILRLTEKQLSALVKLRDAKRKVAVSVRLDPQVLSWLRAKGDEHLTRINDILVNLMEAERRIGSRR